MNSKKSLNNADPNRNLAVGALVVNSACYIFLAVATRLLSQGFQPLTQVYLRIGLGFLIACLIFRKEIRIPAIRTLKAKDFLPLLLMGVVGYSVAVYFITLAVLNTKLVNIAVINSAIPFFTFIYSYVVFGKSSKRTSLPLVIITVFGVLMVSTKSYIPILSQFGKGEFFALLSTATSAWFFVGRKMVTKKLNNSEILLIVMCIACVSTILLSLLMHEKLILTNIFNGYIALGLLLGGVLNVVANKLEIFAFHHIDATLGSQILMLENVFALIFGYLFYKEVIIMPEIIGGLLILGSVYMSNKQAN